MTAIAPDQPISRSLPSNQTSTMQAFPMPSYPMPQQAILSARSRTASPLYSDPSQLDPSRYNALIAAQRGYSAQVQPIAPSPGAPGTPETVGADMNGLGPDTQTAAGGVMRGAAGDFSDPQTWTDFFNMRGTHAGTRAGPPPSTPPVMQQQRVAQPWAPASKPWKVGAGFNAPPVVTTPTTS